MPTVFIVYTNSPVRSTLYGSWMTGMMIGPVVLDEPTFRKKEECVFGSIIRPPNTTSNTPYSLSGGWVVDGDGIEDGTVMCLGWPQRPGAYALERSRNEGNSQCRYYEQVNNQSE